MKRRDCFTDNKAVYISIHLETIDDCKGLFEPLIRNKYSFAIITTVKGWAVIREPESGDKPVMITEFSHKEQIVRYWKRGVEVTLE